MTPPSPLETRINTWLLAQRPRISRALDALSMLAMAGVAWIVAAQIMGAAA